MKDCRYTPTSKFGRYAALFFYPAVGLLLVAVTIWALVDSLIIGIFSWLTILTVAMGFGLAYLLFAMSFCFSAFEKRRFKVSNEGITLSDRGKSFYRWDEVHSVAISVFAAAASMTNYEIVICVVLKPDTDMIFQKLLHGYIYGATHRDAVVIIDYSYETIDQIASVYPGTIIDYRKVQLGNHYK